MNGKLMNFATVGLFMLASTALSQSTTPSFPSRTAIATGWDVCGATLDEILEKINEKYKGDFTDADRVMLNALHDKLIADPKLKSSALTSDPLIISESIFPSAFGTAAMESYMESQESYASLFEDQAKYNAVMSVLAGMVYREMRGEARQ